MHTFKLTLIKVKEEYISKSYLGTSSYDGLCRCVLEMYIREKITTIEYESMKNYLYSKRESSTSLWLGPARDMMPRLEWLDNQIRRF